MRRMACFSMIAVCGAAFGQSLLDCVEPDVLHALVLQGQGERPMVITAAVPAEFSSLRMPAGFSWIGSAERTNGMIDATARASQVAAAWRSNLAPEAARNAAADALVASGWQVQSLLGAVRTVFRSATPMSQIACRDGTPVTINASAMDGVTYVMLNMQRGGNMAACNQPVRPALASGSAMYALLPVLDLPQDPRTGRAVSPGGGGTSTSGDAVSARTEFTITDSATNVARHFAGQMKEQGWTSDADWSGASTAGSSWSRRAEDGGLVQATLTVTASGERRVSAMLRLGRLQ